MKTVQMFHLLFNSILYLAHEPVSAGPVTKCNEFSCSNHGRCVQLWNSYTCDCDMTSYTGPSCSDESTAFMFGPKGGLITFTFPPDKRPDTKHDILALGFITERNNSVLVRIDSGSSNDYMELHIVEGYIGMVYNLGILDHDIKEPKIKVDDNQYHVVRFTRSGPNSTIQIDNQNVTMKYPGGRQLRVLNSHAKVQIGGVKYSKRESISRPFLGVIVGLVFNGHRLLDLAAQSDPRITTEGDIKLLASVPQPAKRGNSTSSFPNNTAINQSPQMQEEAKPGPGYEEDELIISGAGSGCFDDEDECSGFTDAGSGDDLITPVYVPPKTTTSTPPFKTSTVRPVEVVRKLCDDDEEEECVEGSGSGELVPTKVNNVKAKVYVPSTQPTRTDWSTPSYVAPIPQPVPPTVDYDDRSILYTSRPIPPASPPSQLPGRSFFTPRPPPPRPVGPPKIYEVPIPEMPSTVKDEKKQMKIYNKTSAYRTALVIALIAVLLIVIVIIAPIVVFIKVKCHTGGTAKSEEGKNFQFVPVSGTPPLLGPGSQQTQINGATARSTIVESKASKLPKKKNLKEWYV